MEITEINIRKKEFALRTKELELRQEEAKRARGFWGSRGLVTASLLSVLAALIGTLIGAAYTYKIEGEKRRATVIVEAIKTCDLSRAINNVKFLLAMGVIPQEEQFDDYYKKHQDQIPFLPPADCPRGSDLKADERDPYLLSPGGTPIPLMSEQSATITFLRPPSDETGIVKLLDTVGRQNNGCLIQFSKNVNILDPSNYYSNRGGSYRLNIGEKIAIGLSERKGYISIISSDAGVCTIGGSENIELK